jgi:hypothetical protein
LILAFGPHVGAALRDELKFGVGFHLLASMHAGHIWRISPEDPNDNTEGEHSAAYCQKVPPHRVLHLVFGCTNEANYLWGEAPAENNVRREPGRLVATSPVIF